MIRKTAKAHETWIIVVFLSESLPGFFFLLHHVHFFVLEHHSTICSKRSPKIERASLPLNLQRIWKKNFDFLSSFKIKFSLNRHPYTNAKQRVFSGVRRMEMYEIDRKEKWDETPAFIPYLLCTWALSGSNISITGVCSLVEQNQIDLSFVGTSREWMNGELNEPMNGKSQREAITSGALQKLRD